MTLNRATCLSNPKTDSIFLCPVAEMFLIRCKRTEEVFSRLLSTRPVFTKYTVGIVYSISRDGGVEGLEQTENSASS